MTMLEARNIHKVYDDAGQPLEVLKGVNLKIESGKLIAITGPSGAGKSTLLHILGGLDSPSTGKVFLKDENIYNLSDSALSKIRNENIGFVFQFYHLLSEFTVAENVMMPALISHLDTKLSGHKIKDGACALLEKVGLGNRIAHFPNQLSGGEQQRVAIARALVNRPQILFCDEPTGNLDSETGNGVIALLKKLNTENKMTVVLVTHNLELAKIADHVFHLKDGLLVN